MRQAGIVAAGGLYALNNNIDRLADDHDNARRWPPACATRASIDREQVETNMFFVEPPRAVATRPPSAEG